MERAIMVAVYAKGTPIPTVQRRLAELEALIRAAGAQVVGLVSQAREVPETGLGHGALQTLAQEARRLSASVVVFEAQTRPSAIVAAQHAIDSDIRVIDRTQVILDIFAQRAISREGQVQVELAQYRHLEVGLKGDHALSRQGGGIGTRGPGETRLESDRRQIRRRIRELTGDLADIERQRRERRQRRNDKELPLVALVGYTNVGKSTLFRELTHRPQLTGDALFVTLDPTVRRIQIAGLGPVLIADTVGFVDRLPHDLVAAFRSTLTEVRDADVIVEVLSAAPDFPISLKDQSHVVRTTLSDLGVVKTPVVRVLSQWDRVGAGAPLPTDGAVAVSAFTGYGLQELKDALMALLARQYRSHTIRIPWKAAHAWQILYEEFVVLEQFASDEYGDVVVRGSERALYRLMRALNQIMS